MNQEKNLFRMIQQTWIVVDNNTFILNIFSLPTYLGLKWMSVR